MCDVEVCRICLRTNIKLFRMEEFNLNKYYEELNGNFIGVDDDLPCFFCYECAALLLKFHKFKEKCDCSQKALRTLLCKGTLTYKIINNLIIRDNYILKYGNLEDLTLSNRTKTYEMEHAEIDVDLNENKANGFETLGCYKYYQSDYEEFKDLANYPVAEEMEVKHDITTKIEIGNTFEVEAFVFADLPQDEVKPKSLELPQTVKKRMHAKKGKVYTDNNDKEYRHHKSKKNTKVVSEKKKNKHKSKDGDLKVLAFLNSGYWKKYNLTEEEALKEFKARSEDRKYLTAAYKCENCYKGFSQKGMLDRHIPRRHGEALGSLSCPFCKMRFKWAYYLKKHMRQHYVKYECLRCNLVCNLETSAMFHEDYHSGVTRKCPHCDKEFRHMSTFYTHLRTHRSKHTCSFCGESFVSPLGLQIHKKAKHVLEIENIESPMKESINCDVCKIKFDTRKAYDKHLMHSAMHTDDNKPVDENPAKDFLNYIYDKKSKALFKRKSRVEKNVSAVRKFQPRKGKKPTTCHQCGENFDTQAACMKHHLAEHPRTSFFSEKERVICEICGLSLAPGSMPVHLNQHTRSKMYTCEICERSFTTKGMLKIHSVVHTGEKKYGCNLCDKRFTQKGSLNLHFRTIHQKQPYPKRNRRKRNDNPEGDICMRNEEQREFGR